jgi:hypothetical protein
MNIQQSHHRDTALRMRTPRYEPRTIAILQWNSLGFGLVMSTFALGPERLTGLKDRKVRWKFLASELP